MPVVVITGASRSSLEALLNIKSAQLIYFILVFHLAAQGNWSRGHFDFTEIVQGDRRRHFTHSFGRAERPSRRTSRDPANRPVQHASIRPSRRFRAIR